ncbi:MAG TPA: glycine zipper domain-containing protein [Allosphingosinicella sp.]|jgi:hypothetical protein|nr:glycine zipper domain-containing protein [Allosphingosinicella sp.]
MRKTFVAVMMAGSISLGACATTEREQAQIEGAGTGAVVGGALGAGVGALAGDAIAGAAIGAGIGGLAGAVWADNNRDGRADGYYRNGQYYPGTPAGYDPNTGRACSSNVLGTAAGGAALGGAAGAGVGAATGFGLLEGAIAGAVVGGVAGALWADSNNDGCVDGYTREGQYYPGAPQQQYQQQPTYAPRRGERG